MTVMAVDKYVQIWSSLSDLKFITAKKEEVRPSAGYAD